MIRGIETFKKWFKGNEEQYVVIGGTACDILMSDEGLDFRATKDIDIVLIIEAIDDAFVTKFFRYINEARYEHRNKGTGAPEFYRFTDPVSKEYPKMIELFTRKPDSIKLPNDAVLTPLPISESASSLSAILLNDDYYEFLKRGKTILDGVSVLKATHLIPFKAKAWIDLSERKAKGEQIDSKNIRKHKNDIFRLSELISPSIEVSTPKEVYMDMQRFISQMRKEVIALEQLGVFGRTKDQILDELKEIYVEDSSKR